MRRNNLPQGARVDTSATRDARIFHPLAVFMLSLGGAALYTVWIIWRFGGANLGSQFLYVVPIIIPFVSFLLDRAERLQQWKIVGLVVDFLVVGTAMMRVVSNLPYVSGHTLFLTYAILSPASRVTRITASLVLLEVIYLKYFVWHDPVTSSIGILLGIIAALIAHRFGKRKQQGAI
jgi:hypothetical protein